MAEVMVRMGELAASAVEGQMLVSLGLGSCIGLALLDRRVGVAGLAHIVLPATEGRGDVNPLKFADVAIPELIRRVVAAGGRRPLLEAVLVGGASMFAGVGSTLEVGQRNVDAVRAGMKAARIRVAASATGGTHGRTVRVEPKSGLVTVREAGGKDVQLYPAVRTLQEVA